MPYEIKHYKRTQVKLAPKELLEIHPLGKSPVITDGDRTIAETGATSTPPVQSFLQNQLQGITTSLLQHKTFGRIFWHPAVARLINLRKEADTLLQEPSSHIW